MSVYMSGRAGRRGLDDRGVCISSICVHVYTFVLEVCVAVFFLRVFFFRST